MKHPNKKIEARNKLECDIRMHRRVFTYRVKLLEPRTFFYCPYIPDNVSEFYDTWFGRSSDGWVDESSGS